MSAGKFSKFLTIYTDIATGVSVGSAAVGTVFGALWGFGPEDSKLSDVVACSINFGLLGGFVGGAIAFTAPISIPVIAFNLISR